MSKVGMKLKKGIFKTTLNMKEKLKNSRFILKLYTDYLYFRNKFLCKLNPKFAANVEYKKFFGRYINWENPKDLIEKIYWMELNTDTSLWTLCADKYKVREFIKERGCEDTLVKLYGAWKNPYDIDFDKLPNSFVLKANNGCGTVMIVKDKNTLDFDKTKKTLKEWIKRPYGYSSAQLHYLGIETYIIAEELISNSKDKDKALNDYKIWCFDGKPESILVVHDRTKNGYKLSFFDLKWNNISEQTLNKNNPHYWGGDVERPASLDEMLAVAAKLSKGFPEVRADFYDIDGKAYFGELTFSTGYGSYSQEYYRLLGDKVDLNLANKK